MKRPIFLLLCYLLLINNINAQQLNGIIVDTEGNPISNSTVYIKENSKGIVADNLGEFQINLEPGVYTFEFRSLGYESATKSVVMENKDQTIKVALQEKSFLLSTVTVYPGKEDPAYRIMRKAIAYAPYYRYQIKEYSSDVYIKGSLTIDKIPGIFKRAMKVNDSKLDIKSLIGKPLVMESRSSVHFTSPEKYNQQVRALKTSIPEEFEISKGLSIMTSSIYNSDLDGRISPLSKGAFRHYAFKLEDVDYQQDYIVNKIKVIPRKKNPNLFSGYLYILENTWNVYIADLLASEMGTTFHYRINYNAVKPSVYLPTTYDVSMTLNTMGVKGDGRYYASIKYNSVVLDESKKPTSIINESYSETETTKKYTPKQKKIIDEIERLSEKENLSTKEAYKMSNLLSRATEPEEVKKRRESLEIKDIEYVKMTVDSLALKRDSLYWAKYRELPLRDDEIRSYQIKDSLSVNNKASKTENDEREGITVSFESNPKNLFGKIVLGGQFKVTDSTTLRYGGLLGGVKEYNFVDGLWLGQTVTLKHNFKGTNSFSVAPSIYYTTSRKELLWHVNTSLSYAPMRLGRFSLSAGHISRDINGEHGESRLMNSITAGFFGQNFIRFYDSRFIKLYNGIDVANGLRILGSFEIDCRNPLSNTTDFNFAKKIIPENVPNESIYQTHTATNIYLGISYTPFYRYRVNKGQKWYVESKYPNFYFQYKKGVNLFGKENQTSLFDLVYISISQSIKLPPFAKLIYKVSAGGFLNSQNLQMNDYNYFMNNQMLFTVKSLDYSFNLLPRYAFSQKWWVESHLNYQSQYLLIKNLPFLQQYYFDESIHLKGLITENKKLYLEGGYSIGFSNLGRAGIFANYYDNKINEVGLRISYPLFNLFEKPLK